MMFGSYVMPRRFSSSCQYRFWSRGGTGALYEMNAAVTLLPLPGTAATLLNGGGSVRYASGTSGAGEGMTPSVLAGTALVGAAAPAAAMVGARTGVGAAAVVGAAGGGVADEVEAPGAPPPPHAASSVVTAAVAAPPSAKRSTARRLTRCGRVPGRIGSSMIWSSPTLSGSVRWLGVAHRSARARRRTQPASANRWCQHGNSFGEGSDAPVNKRACSA